MMYSIQLFFLDTHLGALCVGLLAWMVFCAVLVGFMSVYTFSLSLGIVVSLLLTWGLGKLIQIGCDR